MTEESGLDRRDALKTLLALGAAAPLAWTRTLPAQAGRPDVPAAGRAAGDLLLPGTDPAVGPAAADQRGPGGRRDLLRGEHLQRAPDRLGDPAAAPGAAAEPGGSAAAADDRSGGRRGPAAARRPHDVGEADRRVQEPGLGGQLGRDRGGAEPGRRGHERQSGAGARRVLQVRQLHRPVPALLQQQRLGGDQLRDGLHHRPAEDRRGGDGQALPRPGFGHEITEHRRRPGHPQRVAVRPALQGRGALPGGHHRRGQAHHGVLGGLPGAGRQVTRRGCPRP